MVKKSDKLKEIIKGGTKPTFGTNPNDPWSTRAGISEENISEDELLNKYLISIIFMLYKIKHCVIFYTQNSLPDPRQAWAGCSSLK